jgi:hypothetical protein
MRSIIIVLSLMLLSACVTNIPQAENFPQSKQKKLMAAQHWNLVSQDAVDQTQSVLAKRGFANDTPLYILPNTKTVFNYAFRKYLIANFIKAGAVVSTKKEGALEIEFDTQVIEHANGMDPEKFGYKPGMATVGVSSFWVLRDVFEHLNFVNGLATIGMAGAYDAYKAKNPGETNVELLLTTTIVHRDRYVMLNADAYYIEKAESRLFEPCKGRNRKLCR